MNEKLHKEEKQVGKCKYCGAAIYLTEKGELLIKSSWDCIHELELEVDKIGSK